MCTRRYLANLRILGVAVPAAAHRHGRVVATLVVSMRVGDSHLYLMTGHDTAGDRGISWMTMSRKDRSPTGIGSINAEFPHQHDLPGCASRRTTADSVPGVIDAAARSAGETTTSHRENAKPEQLRR